MEEYHLSQSETISRRSVLKGTAALAGASVFGIREEARGATQLVQDLQSADSLLPFRHIHLDFHTSPAIEGVGRDFVAPEFARTLKEADVNSITVFAKCHHGMAYYPTKIGVPHPHLQFDLLGEMLAALHREHIATIIYISTLYDQHMWREHGDWRAIDPNGGEEGLRGPTNPTEPQLGGLCANSPYLDYLVAMADEVLSSYRADGVFYDNFVYAETGCSCAYCLAERDKLGLDSRSQPDRIQHMHMVMQRAMDRLTSTARSKYPNGSFLFNGVMKLTQYPEFLHSALKYESHIEIESLPGGRWGYRYFPQAVRRLRYLGRQTRGMTGAFHRSWGDFGTVRNQAALDYECFEMLAQTATCCVGDHLHPSGRLNAITYQRIGETYREVLAKEPWCRDAKPVTEIASLLTLDGADGADSDWGVTSMLTQLGHQFDLVDATADFTPYKVLILPDGHRIDDALGKKLMAYLTGGGKILLSNESGLNQDGKQFALPLGAAYESHWPYDNQYVEVLNGQSNGFSPMVQIAYEPGCAVKATSGATVLARCWSPYFNRTYQHFQVEQVPPSQPTEYAAAVQTSNTIYLSTPIFRTYARYAYVFDRNLVGFCLGKLLPNPLIKAKGPSTMEITLTRQPGRFIVHLLNYVPQRRGPLVDVVEDVFAIGNVKIALRSDGAPQKVYLAPQQEEIRANYKDGYVEATVSSLTGHQMIVFEYA